MMVKFSKMYRDVRNTVTGCPTDLVHDALRQSAIDFCKHTSVLVVTLDPISLVAGESNYDLVSDPGTHVYGLVAANLNGARLQLVTRTQLDVGYPDWESKTGTPQYALFVPGEEQVRLVPEPDAADTDALFVSVVLAPDDNADGIERDIYLRYKGVLAAGAKEKLLMLPNKAWTNPQLASFYGTEFMVGKSRARQHVLTGDSGIAHQVRGRRFAI